MAALTFRYLLYILCVSYVLCAGRSQVKGAAISSPRDVAWETVVVTEVQTTVVCPTPSRSTGRRLAWNMTSLEILSITTSLSDSGSSNGYVSLGVHGAFPKTLLKGFS
jgi:phage baseplate assembly protein gpV